MSKQIFHDTINSRNGSVERALSNSLPDDSLSHLKGTTLIVLLLWSANRKGFNVTKRDPSIV